MLLQIIILIIGFVFLIKGADIFVDGASNLAKNFKIPKMVIALTIVSFGTSAPEFAVSIKSIINGNGEIVIGNVIGSNILNILLILGVSSIIHSLKVKDNTVKFEIPIVVLLSTLLVILMNDKFLNNEVNMLTRGDGIAIILFFLLFIYYLIKVMKKKNVDLDNDELIYSKKKSLLLTLLGIIGIIIGSNLVVESATKIASSLGVSERIIALTIVALGTSLPELVTSAVATKKGEYDIAIGNVVGSNIFNIGVVLGIPIALFGNVSVGTFNIIDMFFLLISAILLFTFSKNDYKIKRHEGIIFIIIFIIYYSIILIG